VTFDLTAFAARVRERTDVWHALELTWSTGPIHPNYGKAVTTADFEGLYWIAQITIWETGETELETFRKSDLLVVSKHYQLGTVAEVDDVIAEFAALVGEGKVPAAAFTYTEPAAGT